MAKKDNEPFWTWQNVGIVYVLLTVVNIVVLAFSPAIGLINRLFNHHYDYDDAVSSLEALATVGAFIAAGYAWSEQRRTNDFNSKSYERANFEKLLSKLESDLESKILVLKTYLGGADAYFNELYFYEYIKLYTRFHLVERVSKGVVLSYEEHVKLIFNDFTQKRAFERLRVFMKDDFDYRLVEWWEHHSEKEIFRYYMSYKDHIRAVHNILSIFSRSANIKYSELRNNREIDLLLERHYSDYSSQAMLIMYISLLENSIVHNSYKREFDNPIRATNFFGVLISSGFIKEVDLYYQKELSLHFDWFLDSGIIKEDG